MKHKAMKPDQEPTKINPQPGHSQILGSAKIKLSEHKSWHEMLLCRKDVNFERTMPCCDVKSKSR